MARVISEFRLCVEGGVNHEDTEGQRKTENKNLSTPDYSDKQGRGKHATKKTPEVAIAELLISSQNQASCDWPRGHEV
jgi:hypothetical protein